MKCMNCGAYIPEDQLICPGCGQEVQIVPDYNPLDDVLAAQVRGAVSETLTININDRTGGRYSTGRTSHERGRVSYSAAGRGTNESRTANGRSNNGRYNTGRYNTGRNPNGRAGAGRVGQSAERTGRVSQQERAQRRRQAEKKRMIARRKRRRALIFTSIAVVFVIILSVLCYQNSYTGQVKKGYRLLTAREYDDAVTCFQKSIKKDKKRAEAYTGLSEVYIAQDDLEKAEQMFLSAIAGQPSNTELYRAAIMFFMDTNQEVKVSKLLDSCSSDIVLVELNGFVSEVPKFSLDDSEVFDEVQALELTSSGKAIYYTTNKTDPTVSSTKYAEPIKLDEGETEVRAISVNEKGIPSLVVSKTYVVEFPIADAPSVTPSTGQYDESQTIEVVVPDNYEAYYTLDGSDPDPASSSTYKYTGPVNMPEGRTNFCVVLVDKKGRLSDVTKRNYELIISEEEQDGVS